MYRIICCNGMTIYKNINSSSITSTSTVHISTHTYVCTDRTSYASSSENEYPQYPLYSSTTFQSYRILFLGGTIYIDINSFSCTKYKYHIFKYFKYGYHYVG